MNASKIGESCPVEVKMNASDIPVPSRPAGSSSLGERLSRHWFELFLIIYGLWVWTPFLAPMLMNIGWSGTGKAIYFVYSLFCHQLPERSFFLFGEKAMYSLNEIQAAWQDTINSLLLRRFIGNEGMGWKIAWSDRMISFYTSIWLFAVAWWGCALLLLPIILDGSTYMISDVAGIGRASAIRMDSLPFRRITSSPLPSMQVMHSAHLTSGHASSLEA
jgi:uncharacterized membrane protein